MNTKVKSRLERISCVVFLGIFETQNRLLLVAQVDVDEGELNDGVWNDKVVLFDLLLEGYAALEASKMITRKIMSKRIGE